MYFNLRAPHPPIWRIARAIGVVLLLTAVPALTAVDHQSLRFRERTGDTVVYLTSDERVDQNGYVLSSRSSLGEEHHVIVDDQLESVRWRHRFVADDTDYTAVRTGRRIELTGTHRGTRISRSYSLGDDAPWIQSIERSLQAFVVSDSRRTEFYTVQPDDFQLRRLQAVRRGRTTVDVDGVATDAWEIRVSVAGIASIFWSATYWFRTSDGQFVRSEAVRGWPGTPVTVVEMVRTTPSP
ncbi:MAG: hypothetical protein EA382_06035 [Spirochaetaceae bacterium]|nr:MAG: hypothetical protein EA382_06035 [Spirochaetaceae bacterium]